MAIPEMTDDLEIIEKLSDRPNQGNALSSAELKALFDKGPKLIKQFINSIMIPALNKLDGAASFKGGHEELTGRDSADQHPMSAIKGLVDALSKKAADKHNHNANEVNEGVLSTDRIPVVPVKKGGHGGKTRKDGFTNLAFIGNDPVTEATDTPSKWLELGNGYAGITSLCTVKQPNQYGTIISLIVNNFNVHQIFIGADADLSFRCGNRNQGWIFNWRSVMTMTEPMILVENVHYGKDFPKNPKIGQIYWTPEVMEDV